MSALSYDFGGTWNEEKKKWDLYGDGLADLNYSCNPVVRIGAVSVLSKEQAQQAQAALGKEGDASLRKFEWSEGGDKVYLRYDKPVGVENLTASLKSGWRCGACP